MQHDRLFQVAGSRVAPSGPSASLMIAESEELVREALAVLCQTRGNYRPAVLASDGDEALAAVRTHKPDLALVNIDLAGLHALELVSKCAGAGLPTRFVILAHRYDRKSVLESLRAGVKGFVLRSGPADGLFDALNQVRLGGVYLAPQVGANRLFLQPSENETSQDPIGHLSSREYQVFTMLVDGVRAKEIAARLELSPKTVDTYRASLMRKSDIHDVAGLVKFALRCNLVTSAHHA